MIDRRQLPKPLSLTSLFILLLVCLPATSTWGQTQTAPADQSRHATCPSPVPPPQIPANPLLVGHTNFFCPVKVYDLENDPSSKSSFPAGLNYNVYTAVGFDLANSMMLVGPSGVVMVDTVG
jgi:hypothetical protein